jgi:hypothetical protein
MRLSTFFRSVVTHSRQWVCFRHACRHGTSRLLQGCSALVGWLLVHPVHAAAPPPPWGTPIMQPGIAALTCAAQQTDASSNSVPAANAFPFGLVDLRNPSPVPHYTTLGSGAILWNPPMYHHPDWSVDKIGCVFGIAVDRDGNIYLAAHSLYVPFWGPPWFGNPYLMLGSLAGPNPTNASGTIYRVDALTLPGGCTDRQCDRFRCPAATG